MHASILLRPSSLHEFMESRHASFTLRHQTTCMHTCIHACAQCLLLPCLRQRHEHRSAALLPAPPDSKILRRRSGGSSGSSRIVVGAPGSAATSVPCAIMGLMTASGKNIARRIDIYQRLAGLCSLGTRALPGIGATLHHTSVSLPTQVCVGSDTCTSKGGVGPAHKCGGWHKQGTAVTYHCNCYRYCCHHWLLSSRRLRFFLCPSDSLCLLLFFLLPGSRCTACVGGSTGIPCTAACADRPGPLPPVCLTAAARGAGPRPEPWQAPLYRHPLYCRHRPHLLRAYCRQRPMDRLPSDRLPSLGLHNPVSLAASPLQLDWPPPHLPPSACPPLRSLLLRPPLPRK